MKIKPNVVDRLVNYFSPQHAIKRARARIQSRRLRAYDASTLGRRTEHWLSSNASANLEIAESLTTIRNRSRDLVRNNAYAERAVRSLVANLIGSGIIPQARGVDIKYREAINTHWKRWANTELCDFDKRHNFYGLQSLITREMIESGECLVRLIKRKQTHQDGSLPIQLQVLEADFIDTTKNSESLGASHSTHSAHSGHIIYQGIEFNKNGERVAYWLYNQHPSDPLTFSKHNLSSSRVPANEIIHLYRMDRAGQLRGVPWSAPVVIKLKDLEDYNQAELVRHKTSACFVGFIREMDNEGLTDSENNVISDKLEPGILEILPPGKDITFSNPPESKSYTDYINANLRAIAIGFGIPYEVLAGDYSQVNFSSGRMGWLEFQRHINQWQTQLIIPLLCQRVWKWFIESLALTRQLPKGLEHSKDIYFANWTPPRREMIDPLKEVKAIRDQVRAGFMTLSEAMRIFGYDPEEQYAKLKEDANTLDTLELTLDTDPRHDDRAEVSSAESL